MKQVVSTVLEKVCLCFCPSRSWLAEDIDRCSSIAIITKTRRLLHPRREKQRTDQRPYSMHLDEWDSAFMDVEKNTLFDIILAAYYLDIRPLL